MEKILSENEKIRRAEEIYFRRNNQNINLLGRNENNKNPKRYFGSKIFLNLLILFNIAIVLYCIQNRNIIFKDEFLKKCSEYNINISNGVSGLINSFLTENSEVIINENIVKQEDVSGESNIEQNSDVNTDQATNEIQENVENQVSSISQMDDDIENLKKIYNFISPIKGIISSGFGARESEYQNVTGYHTGTDIAADKGTNIIASMEGIVTLVSSKGDYRKTYKNKM